MSFGTLNKRTTDDEGDLYTRTSSSQLFVVLGYISLLNPGLLVSFVPTLIDPIRG